MCIDNNGKYFDCGSKLKKPLLKNVIKAAAAVVTGEAVKVDELTYKARLVICANCDKLSRFQDLQQGADLSKLDICSECGCVVKAKAFFKGKDFECPLGKWN